MQEKNIINCMPRLIKEDSDKEKRDKLLEDAIFRLYFEHDLKDCIDQQRCLKKLCIEELEAHPEIWGELRTMRNIQ